MGRFTLLFHLPRGFAEYLRQRTTPPEAFDADSGSK
jgi:hypothetical protein